MGNPCFCALQRPEASRRVSDLRPPGSGRRTIPSPLVYDALNLRLTALLTDMAIFRFQSPENRGISDLAKLTPRIDSIRTSARNALIGFA